MTYSLSMKNLLVLLVVTLAATGCRTTHEADAEELANLGEVDNTLQTGENPADDFGQFSLGAFSSIQPALRYLSNKDRNSGQVDAAIVQSPEEIEALRLVSFVSDGSRDEWPACLTELENGVIYDNCVLGVEVPSVSIGFTADGEYSWTDNSSTSSRPQKNLEGTRSRTAPPSLGVSMRRTSRILRDGVCACVSSFNKLCGALRLAAHG